MSAAERLAALDDMPAIELIGLTEQTLLALASVMNQETNLLRAGHYQQAAHLTASKASMAQDYVGLARAVQRQLARLNQELPDAVSRLRSGHERLATQMADNLRVIATARAVTEDLLNDVANSIGRQAQTKTYGAGGQVSAVAAAPARGIAVNRAL